MNRNHDQREGDARFDHNPNPQWVGFRTGAWRAHFGIHEGLPVNSPASEQATSAAKVLSKPDRLLVTAVREGDAEAAMVLLESAGLPHSDHLVSGVGQTTALVPQSSLGGFDQVGAWMQQHPDAHLLLLMPDPITEVASALSSRVRPAQALKAWSDSVTEALALVRSVGRRRSSVFMADPLFFDPQAFLKSLGERLQLALVFRSGERGAGSSEGASESQDESQVQAIFRMMAENALWQAPSVRAQVTELLALAVPVTSDEWNRLPAVEAVFDEYQHTLAEPIQDTKEENDLLLQELHRVQEELEREYHGKDKLVQEKDKLAKQLDALEKKAAAEQDKLIKQLEAARAEKQADEPDARYQDLQEENELLLQQLHHVQEELERYYLKQVEFSGSELAEADAKIEALLNSKSWKITRPLRVILGVLTGNKTDL